MIKVWEENNDYFCELWGGSTKHPDASFKFSEWKDIDSIIKPKYQVFQWLLWIASRRQFPFHAKEIAKYALENWYNWE